MKGLKRRDAETQSGGQGTHPLVWVNGHGSDIVEFIASLSDEEVGGFLAECPQGTERIAELANEPEPRWFLFDLFLARPAWFARAQEDMAAKRRCEEAQGTLL